MASQAILELTDANFEQEVIQSDQPVLVDFWAEWCMPCRMLAPTIEELAREFAGKVKVGKLDTDANREAAMKFGISAIPTVIIFHQGQVAKKLVGLLPKQQYAQELTQLAGQA